MNRLLAIGTLLLSSLAVLLSSCSNGIKGDSMQAIEKNGDGVYAVINTKKGDIVLALEYKKTPLTVTNFVGLAEGNLNAQNPGKPFYDGLKFHRVIQDFMIQGGDPNGTGSGGPGYQFADEFVSDLRLDKPGILAMANAGPNTNGSQFFITHKDTTWLNDKHTVFGHVISGQDVVNAIAQGDTMDSISIVRRGSEAEAFKPTKANFDALAKVAEDRQSEIRKAQEAAQMAQIDKLSEGAKKTESGLRYFVRKAGNGSKPKRGQMIQAHYEGRLVNGTVFDSSYSRKEPFQFSVGSGQVIKGWDEALLDMSVGEKRTIVLPPELAYGSRGAGGVIPPNAWLVFDVELVAFK